ncbi:MAG: TSUP family transporter [Bacillota bacterium]|nr:TSUP family transporter [Bacillota bacterium]
MIITVCPLIFVAGFVDSIAGGGGLISLPAYLFAGLPVHYAYGTNKLSSTFGTMFSAFRFLKNGKIHLKSAVAAVISALFGSYLGAKAALALSDIYLRYFLIIMLPVAAVFIITRKKFGEENRISYLSGFKIFGLSLLIGLVMGVYDGFFGPGTGTFLILLFTGVIGFNLTVASGNAKLVNLASNIAALVTFSADSKVFFELGIPAAIFGIAGNWLGSGLAIKNGAKIIKPVLVVVIILLFAKILYDVFK